MHDGPNLHDASNGAWLVYDGDCPFCSSYVRHVRFKENFGRLELVDGRSDDPVAREVASRYDLDEGMVLKLGEQYYFADDCIHVLALLADTGGWFGRINGAIFRHRTLSRWLYPVLRSGRNLTLALLGRRQIGLRHGRPGS